MAKFTHNPDLDPQLLLNLIKERGAPTIKEMKTELQTDSASIRMSVAVLQRQNLVMPVPYGKAICYMLVTGERGAPSPRKARTEATNSRAVAIHGDAAVTTPAVTDRDTANPISRKWQKLATMVEIGEITERQFQAACKKLGVDPNTGMSAR